VLQHRCVLWRPTNVRVVWVVGVGVCGCAVTPCPAGQYAGEDYACVACPPGKYKFLATAEIPDPHPCFSCLGNGEWSAAGAAHCACNAGYGGVAGGQAYGTCTLCAPGKFKSVTGDGDCAPCAVGVTCGTGFFVAECTPARDRECRACTNALRPHAQYVSAAPPGSRNCSVGCSPGFTDGGMGGACEACPPGRFKAGPGQGQCAQCEAGKFSLGAASECSVCRSSCPAGFVLNGTCGAGSADDAACAACPANTYGDGSSCVSCDPNAVSAAGSPAATSCKCNEGYAPKDVFAGVAVTRTCVLCQQNTFSAQGQDWCSACDPNAQALAGSASATACRCNAGFSGPNGGACAACAAGKYKAVAGPTACMACGDNLSDGRGLASSPPARCVRAQTRQVDA